MVSDLCPCPSPSGQFTDSSWICCQRDQPHLDLSYWAFDDIVTDVTLVGSCLSEHILTRILNNYRVFGVWFVSSSCSSSSSSFLCKASWSISFHHPALVILAGRMALCQVPPSFLPIQFCYLRPFFRVPEGHEAHCSFRVESMVADDCAKVYRWARIHSSS